MQLFQLFDDIEEGATYTIRFRAKADVPREIGFNAQRNGMPGWETIGGAQRVAISDQWKDYEIRFQAKGVAPVNRITFILGQQTGTVWIADFTVTKGAK